MNKRHIQFDKTYFLYFFIFLLLNVIDMNIVQRQLNPIIKMMKRKKCHDMNNFDEICNTVPQQQQQQQNEQSNTNDTNNNIEDLFNENDDNENDSISLEVLWQPQNGTQITADVVFIHGLHGMSRHHNIIYFFSIFFNTCISI